jgi:hypothetical protein
MFHLTIVIDSQLEPLICNIRSDDDTKESFVQYLTRLWGNSLEVAVTADRLRKHTFEYHVQCTVCFVYEAIVRFEPELNFALYLREEGESFILDIDSAFCKADNVLPSNLIH